LKSNGLKKEILTMTRIKLKETNGLKLKRGRPSLGKKPSKIELEKLYIKESNSIREVAEILGCSKDMIHRALKEYGIELRTCRNRSRLRKLTLAELEEGVKEKGIREYARELKIANEGLYSHLKAIKETNINTRSITFLSSTYLKLFRYEIF